jgi:hypothetical protein
MKEKRSMTFSPGGTGEIHNDFQPSSFLYNPFRQVFPNYTTISRPVSKDSALAKIKAKRAAQRQGLMEQGINHVNV